MKIQEFKHYFLVDNVKVHWNFRFLPEGFEAITLFGHVFDKRSKEELYEYLNTYYGRVMVNHEHIHMMQAESFRFGYFSFYILYIWWWIKGMIKHGLKDNIPYYYIPFEQEAYQYERDFNYDKVLWKDFRWTLF